MENAHVLIVNQTYISGTAKNDKTIKPRMLSYSILLNLYHEKDEKFTRYSFYPINEVIPVPYDIIDLKMDNGFIKTGWHTGQEWYCRKKKDHEKIIGWRKKTFNSDDFIK